MARGVDVVITAIVISALLLLGLGGIIDPLADVAIEQEQAGQQDDTVLLSGTQFVSVTGKDGIGTNEVIRDSRNFSMRFTGAPDSELTSDANIDLASGNNWSIHTGVAVDQASLDADNMTVLAAGAPDLILRYHNRTGQRANFSAYWVGTSNTFQVNVSAGGTDATKFQHVFVNRSGDNVTIRRNTTLGESVNVTQDTGNFDGTLNASDENALDGRLDETRIFNSSLNSSQRQALINDPVAPLTNATRTARIMYDAGSGTSVNIYFASADATATNISYDAGYNGSVLAAGTDYEWRTDGPQLRARAGGDIDGAPAAFAVYDLKTGAVQIAERISQGIVVGGLIVVVLMATVIIRALRDL